MRSFKSTKLLALAAPAALFLSAPSAFAGGAMSAPAAEVAPIATPAPHTAAHTRTAAAFGAFAAMLRTIALVASTAPTQPMMDADGCPLPGNVGKGGGAHDRCEVRARVQTASATPAPGSEQ